MTTSTDTDLTVLEGLDFDLACDITRGGAPACGTTATWLALLSPHCIPARQPFTKFLCPEHYEVVINGGTARCRDCGETVVFLDHLIQLERIKP
jgi:hypothetical protein